MRAGRQMAQSRTVRDVLQGEKLAVGAGLETSVRDVLRLRLGYNSGAGTDTGMGGVRTEQVYYT